MVKLLYFTPDLTGHCHSEGIHTPPQLFDPIPVRLNRPHLAPIGFDVVKGHLRGI